MSRERMLADVRSALRLSMVQAHRYPSAPLPPPAPPGPAVPVERFRARFQALGGRWHETRPADLASAIAAIARECGGDLLLGDDPGGPLGGLAPGALEALGIRVERAGSRPADPDRFGLSVTGVACAIADSGTFGIVAGPGQGRLTSVIAPVHLVVLSADRVVPALADFLALAREPLRTASTSAAILITGPSRTADIEGQLIVGVHGPREIHCLLVSAG